MKTSLCAVVCAGALIAGASPALATSSGEHGRILFDSDREGEDIDIWSMRPDGSKLVNLTPDGSNPPGEPGETAYFDAQASWRPDGRKIAFVSDRPTATNIEGDSEVYVMNDDGSNQTQITFNALNELFPAWAPDGRAIVFVRDLDPDRGDDVNDDDLFTMDADGTDLTKLTDNRRHEFAPAFSPDGTRIAFNREGRNGRFGVWIMNADGSSAQQQTFGLFDFFPDWQPV